MLNKVFVYALLFLCFISLLSACLKVEPILYPEDLYDCSDKDWGTLYLSDTTKAFFRAYAHKQKVIFKDSLGTELSYNISRESKFYSYIEKYQNPPKCPNELKTITSQNEELQYFFSNKDSTKNLILYAFAYLNSDFSSKKNENIKLRLSNGDLIYNQKTIDLDKIYVQVNFNRKTVMLFGKSYKDVITKDNHCFISSEYGILAFRDLDKKLWVFDRFE